MKLQSSVDAAVPEPSVLCCQNVSPFGIAPCDMSHHIVADAYPLTSVFCCRLTGGRKLHSVRLRHLHVQEKAQICQLADTERRAFWMHRNACELLCQAAAEAEQSGVLCF